MLRVLLVRPPGRFRDLAFPDGPMVGPPRALLHLAGAVRDDPRVQVRLIDALAEPDPDVLATPERPVLFGLAPDEVARRAAAWDPHLVGISVMAHYYRRETLELCEALRRALPGAVLLLGGPEPTVEPEGYLEAAPIDAVCVGEGEATFAELVGRLADGRPWEDVAGLATRAGRTPARPLLDDVEGCVPDLSALDLSVYFGLAAKGWRSRPAFGRPGVERSVDVVTSRGCPYRCTFCVIHTSMGRRFRARSPGAVVEELRGLVALGVEHVHFEDDVLNLDRRRFADLLRALRDARLPLTWDTPNGVRADLLDEQTVHLCREAGCVSLTLAVESGSQRVLDELLRKDLRLEDVERAARWCHEAELDALLFTIVGLPGETVAEAEQTLAFGLDLFERFGTTPLLQVWRPYVGTELHDRAEAAGQLRDADPAALHAATGIPYTQFRDRVVRDEVFDVRVLADLFARYRAALADGQLRRWRRAGIRWADTGHDDVGAFLTHAAPFLHAYRRSVA
ncbi:MAG: B12-binding domain-containing radical SAM protein [Alphaproteobacteria bacterium]|nr:B12-binding domain-containing radical SAM protein [Alphaproteobacteria bacterium]